jgi:hypothetical protein
MMASTGLNTPLDWNVSEYMYLGALFEFEN